MRAVRNLAAGRGDVLTPLFGALATVLAAWLSVHRGATVGIGLAFALSSFLFAVLLFLYVPHLAVAGMVPIFATTPARYPSTSTSLTTSNFPLARGTQRNRPR